MDTSRRCEEDVFAAGRSCEAGNMTNRYSSSSEDTTRPLGSDSAYGSDPDSDASCDPSTDDTDTVCPDQEDDEEFRREFSPSSTSLSVRSTSLPAQAVSWDGDSPAWVVLKQYLTAPAPAPTQLPYRRDDVRAPDIACAVCCGKLAIPGRAAGPGPGPDEEVAVVLPCGDMVGLKCFNRRLAGGSGGDGGSFASCPKCNLVLKYTDTFACDHGVPGMMLRLDIPVAEVVARVPLTQFEGGSIPRACAVCRVRSAKRACNDVIELLTSRHFGPEPELDQHNEVMVDDDNGAARLWRQRDRSVRRLQHAFALAMQDQAYLEQAHPGWGGKWPVQLY